MCCFRSVIFLLIFGFCCLFFFFSPPRAPRPPLTCGLPLPAVQVCASWIASGVNRDKIDLQRLLNLLLKALDGTLKGPDPSYNERATTMLQLGVLESWATLFTRAKEGGESTAYLMRALQPQLERLEELWLKALQDYALVSLPPEYNNQVPEAGNFYSKGTRATVRGYFEQAYPELLRALALRRRFADRDDEATAYLILGLGIRTLTSSAEPGTSVPVLTAIREVRCSPLWRDFDMPARFFLCVAHTSSAAQVVAKTNVLASDAGMLEEVLPVLKYVLRTQGLSGKGFSV